MREAPPRTAGLYSTIQTIQRGNDRRHNRGKRRWNSMRNRNNTTNTAMVEDSVRVLSGHIKNAGGKTSNTVLRTEIVQGDNSRCGEQ